MVYMDNYLNLAKREVLKEMTAEIEANFFRYFKKHPELDSSRESSDDIARKYWYVVDIENSLIGKEWTEDALDNTTKELQEVMQYIRNL